MKSKEDDCVSFISDYDSVITVRVDIIENTITPLMSGACIEDVNHELYGGLYAQMIFGESFEELPKPVPGWSYCGEVSGMWDSIVTGDAEAHFKWDNEIPFNTDHSQMIRLNSVTDGTAGVANRSLNRWGIFVQNEQTYEGCLYLRGGYGGEVTVSLQNVTGTKTYAMQKLSGIRPEWIKYPIRLVSDDTDINARLAIWIDQPGVIWVDQVVLMPTGEELFKGLPIRADIARVIVEQGLTVLRLGGSMINASGYKWKQMIGDIDRRRQYEGSWYPCSTRGFLIEEFVQFCRKAGIEPVVAINIFEEPEDAADLIEYLNSPTTSRWGGIRAENGNPAPYNVRYIEIGNEEQNNRLYLERFQMLYDAMRPKDPYVQFIIGCWWEPNNPNSRDIVYQLNGKAAMWDLHVGGDNLHDGDRTEEMILQMQQLLKEWSPGTTMKACILEENGGLHNFQRALGHAHIRNTAERFGDFIRIECPANCLQPDGQNDNGWDQGQVFFNNHQVWFQPPAYAQQMAARHYQPYRIKTHVSCSELDVTATKSESGDTIILKVVNISEKLCRTRIEIEGISSIAPQAKTVTLKGDLNTINTAENPCCLVPIEGSIEGISTKFVYTFPCHSYIVIELKNVT